MKALSEDRAEQAEGSWRTRVYRSVRPALKLPTVMVSGVVALVVSVGATWTTNQWQNRETKLMREQAAFIDEARSLDSVIAGYVLKVIDGKAPDNDATQLVVGNIVKQNSLLEQMYPALSDHGKKLAGEYQHLLVDFRQTVPASSTVLEMRPFWEGASKMLVTRNKLIETLQH